MGRFASGVSRRMATQLTNAMLGYNSRGKPIRKNGGTGCLVMLLIIFSIFITGLEIVLASIK